MKKFIYLWGFFVLILITGCKPKTPREISDFTPQAEFIFIGTIQLKNSATLLTEDFSDLAVVMVDNILSAPKIFQPWEKKQITVKLKDLPSSKVGDQKLFFTKSWLFGEEIAVTEIGSFKPGIPDTEKLKSQVMAVQKTENEKNLQLRLTRADFVVLGTINNVIQESSAPLITEHDPMWVNAELKVEKVLKGNISEGTFTFSFANSNDIMWMNAPKPKEGQEGIWILHEKQPEGFKAPYPVLLNNEDLLTRNDLELCLKLLKK